MQVLSEFEGIDLVGLEAAKEDLANCRQTNSNEPQKGCAKCNRVMNCAKIKDFVTMHFDIAISRLKQCQKSNNANSCWDCEHFFSCEIRKDYVAATYEKLNEGRGGEFDF